MTLDEAIAHCEEVANDNNTCERCASDHMQLAMWLRDYKKVSEALEEEIARRKEVTNMIHKLNGFLDTMKLYGEGGSLDDDGR